MTLGREYRYQGQAPRYLDASCPAPKGTRAAVFPLALASFSFAGGAALEPPSPGPAG